MPLFLFLKPLKITDVLPTTYRCFGTISYGHFTDIYGHQILVAFQSLLVALWPKICPPFVQPLSNFWSKFTPVLPNLCPFSGVALVQFSVVLVYFRLNFNSESAFVNFICSSAFAFLIRSKIYLDCTLSFHSRLFTQRNSFDQFTIVDRAADLPIFSSIPFRVSRGFPPAAILFHSASILFMLSISQ